MAYFFLILAILAVSISLVIVRRTRSVDGSDTVRLALVPPSLLAAGIIVWSWLGAAPFMYWNSPCLAPTFAVYYGYDLYYPFGEGPMLSTMYGPATALAFLPSVFAVNPTEALLFADLLNVIYFSLPIALVCLRLDSDPKRRAGAALAALLAFAGLALTSTGLRDVARHVHADAPCVGLGAVACLAMVWSPARPGWKRHVLSALLVALSASTKQVALPMFLALPFFCAAAWGRSDGLRNLLAMTAVGAVTASVWILLHGVGPLWFNLLTVPGNYPWQIAMEGARHPRMLTSALVTLEILRDGFWIGLIGAVGWNAARGESGAVPARGEAATGMHPRAWMLFMLAGAAFIPTSIMGRAKVGGNLNSFFALYFFGIAAVLLLHRAVTATDRTAARVAGAVFLLLQANIILHALDSLPQGWRDWRRLERNPEQQAFEFLLDNPGRAYFSWNPIAHIMAEGKVYHGDSGVWDRDISGYKPSDEYFREHIPPDFWYVAYHERYTTHYASLYLPEYSQPVGVNGLDGWRVFKKKPDSETEVGATAEAPPADTRVN